MGTCGWRISLRKYAEEFPVVEVNTTFYRLPRKETCKRWRKSVPSHFSFTVKVWKRITHERRFENCEEDWKEFLERTSPLQPDFYLFQTPPSFNPLKTNVERAFEFLEGLEVPFAWEVRGDGWEKLKWKFGKAGIEHAVDPLRTFPPFHARIGYFRLHGFGSPMPYRYRFSDEELVEIHRRLSAFPEGYVFFNNVWMLEDARRFKELLS